MGICSYECLYAVVKSMVSLSESGIRACFLFALGMYLPSAYPSCF